MTIDEAIEVLEDIVDTAHYSDYPDDHGAIRLGIEALKFCKDLEDRGALPSNARLPGETKD